MSAKAAFFDVDGTLAKGYLIIDFPHYLHEKGLFNPEEIEFINQQYAGYKKGEITYLTLARSLPEAYARGIKGQKESDVVECARNFVSEHPERAFSFSKGLIELVKSRGFEPVLVSGSPQEIVQAFGDSIGAGTCLGTECDIKDGVYTGGLKLNAAIFVTKRGLVESYVKENKLNPLLCAAFGDTDRDLALLGMVGFPVAINPNKRFRSFAEAKGWLVCGGDNVIPEVEKYLQISNDISPPNTSNTVTRLEKRLNS
ncbi:MAG: HAD-IB family hydrolase [Candidatus Altiarchaeota archaeon]